MGPSVAHGSVNHQSFECQDKTTARFRYIPTPPVCHHFCINAQSLGPDPGHLSNSKNWKRTTPRSFRSPYFAQGDIGKKNIPTPLLSFYNILTLFVGFFYYKKKKYGAFFCAVQTYTGFVYAAPIKNLKNETLFDAVRAMSKVKMQISSF